MGIRVGDMKLDKLTKQLIDKAGYSQSRLAQEITDLGAKCSQPTIWRIIHGLDPSFSIGTALQQLHQEKLGKAA